MLWLETNAKKRNMTVIHFAEELFERELKRLIAKEGLQELL